MLLRILGALLAIALCTWCQHASASSAMQLRVQQPNGTQATATATAVDLGGSGWLITAYHNFSSPSCGSDPRRCASLIPGTSARAIPLEEAILPGKPCVIPALGIVAMRVSKTKLDEQSRSRVTFAKLTSSPVKAGQSVLAVGNPRIQILKQPSTPFNYVGAGTIGMRDTAVARLPNGTVRTSAEDTELLIIDGFTITFGFSGGPVFADRDLDGTLLGIVQGGDSSQRNRSWAVPSDLIYAALSSQKCEAMGVADGFHSNLYSLDPQSSYLLTVSSFTPNPLVFDLGQDTKVTVALHFVDAASAELMRSKLLFLPKLQGLAGVTHVAGLEFETLDGSEATFAVTLRVDERIPDSHFAIPFSVSLGGTTEIGSFELQATVELERRLSLMLSPGFTYSVGSGAAPSAPRRVGSYMVLELSANFTLWNPRTIFALRGGLGPSLLHAEQRMLDPRGQTVLESDPPDERFGGRAQVLAELRFWERTRVGWRLALGAAAEAFSFEVPESAERSMEDTQWSLLLETGPSFAFDDNLALCARLLAAYQWPPALDMKYIDPTTLEAISTDPQLAIGIGATLEYDL